MTIYVALFRKFGSGDGDVKNAIDNWPVECVKFLEIAVLLRRILKDGYSGGCCRGCSNLGPYYNRYFHFVSSITP